MRDRETRLLLAHVGPAVVDWTAQRVTLDLQRLGRYCWLVSSSSYFPRTPFAPRRNHGKLHVDMTYTCQVLTTRAETPTWSEP